jgi:hypothetical protein
VGVIPPPALRMRQRDNGPSCRLPVTARPAELANEKRPICTCARRPVTAASRPPGYALPACPWGRTPGNTAPRETRRALAGPAHRIYRTDQVTIPTLRPSEKAMRLGTILLVIWLIIGAVAAGQRHYFGSSGPSSAKASTIAVTIAAGRSPLPAWTRRSHARPPPEQMAPLRRNQRHPGPSRAHRGPSAASRCAEPHPRVARSPPGRVLAWLPASISAVPLMTSAASWVSGWLLLRE